MYVFILLVVWWCVFGWYFVVWDVFEFGGLGDMVVVFGVCCLVGM